MGLMASNTAFLVIEGFILWAIIDIFIALGNNMRGSFIILIILNIRDKDGFQGAGINTFFPFQAELQSIRTEFAFALD